jgi:pimeloyl-ACP methyl ester carboxylesterase
MAALQSHGVEVHFELVGRGFPLVMLPPAGFDGSFWRLAGYIDALDDVVTCVPVDPRGLGGSTRPAEAGGYRVGALAGDVLAIADQQGFARFAVWGASLGGAVGMLLAAEYPDRVAGLVLSGMCPVFDYSELRHTWRYLARLAREAGDVADAFRHVCDQEGLPADSWIRRAEQGDADVVASLLEGLVEYDWDRRVNPSAVTSPTLVVLGDLEDPIAVTAPVVEVMPRAHRVTLAAVGHVGGLIDAERVLTHVRPFLQSIAASAPARGAYSGTSRL